LGSVNQQHQHEVMKEEKEDMKEAKSEEPTEERSEKEQKKEENKDQGKKEKKKEKMKEEDLQGSWKDFFYNSRTGELLGRTASSWGKIMSVSRLRSDWSGFNLKSTEPSWVIRRKFDLRSSLLVMNEYVVMIIIIDSRSSDRVVLVSADAAQYLQHCHEYNDSMQERNDLCLVGEYTDQDQGSIKKVCQFKRSILRQCSGLPDTSFGYAEGKPCIIVKMNRVIGLKPEGDPYINCTAKRDSPLQMQYFPPEGRLDKMFFPYYGKKLQPDYVQPLVAVKLLLTKDDYNIEQTVECKVEGSHLRNNDERDKYMGRVTFRVKVLQ
uniref:Sodium/potassium-transporting ATPase subunit beta-3 n=1 Tax=Oryzias sinensis TaxID=183150 RepID=A0A8C7Z1L4_9TELE